MQLDRNLLLICKWPSQFFTCILFIPPDDRVLHAIYKNASGAPRTQPTLHGCTEHQTNWHLTETQIQTKPKNQNQTNDQNQIKTKPQKTKPNKTNTKLKTKPKTKRRKPYLEHRPYYTKTNRYHSFNTVSSSVTVCALQPQSKEKGLTMLFQTYQYMALLSVLCFCIHSRKPGKRELNKTIYQEALCSSLESVGFAIVVLCGPWRYARAALLHINSSPLNLLISDSSIGAWDRNLILFNHSCIGLPQTRCSIHFKTVLKRICLHMLVSHAYGTFVTHTHISAPITELAQRFQMQGERLQKR